MFKWPDLSKQTTTSLPELNPEDILSTENVSTLQNLATDSRPTSSITSGPSGRLQTGDTSQPR
eukprot:6129148-Pyramimonas_sp.AAC.1